MSRIRPQEHQTVKLSSKNCKISREEKKPMLLKTKNKDLYDFDFLKHQKELTEIKS